MSIVIVNYNVEYFLEQCLNSVFNALGEVKGEVFVVDNNSIDQSVNMVRERFPEVKLIANKQNLGFSKANNQAIKQACGRHILLLNPDTVVEEDTFEKVVGFMDQHEDAGGLGVRMIDGKGKFLPESKRGLPTPSVAFFKIFGLSRIFPKSSIFSRYHLGHLSEFETAEIDILSGAFMLMRKSVLDEIGLLDETFFMYGEDIDLSYRIQLSGSKNYYFPETRIIHYKGESTKKSSVNYVFVFYRAMVIFAQKHFSKNHAFLFSFLINIAIYFRAGLAIGARFVKRAFLPVVDYAFILTGLFLLTRYWLQMDIQFPEQLIRYAIPSYALIWLMTNFYASSYDFPQKLSRFLTGTLFGTFVILAFYALLPKSFQFSRLYILVGTGWVIGYYILSRIYLHFTVRKKFRLNERTNSRFLIVGSEKECERVEQVLKQINRKTELVLSVSPEQEKQASQAGTLSQLDQLVLNYKADEIIFCARDIAVQDIIQWMIRLEDDHLDFKIAQPDSSYLIGSNSIHSAGDLYFVDINEISKPFNKRLKRTLDIIVSFLGLLFSPILLFWYQQRWQFVKNMFHCFIGKKTLVGYSVQDRPNENFRLLPRIRQGILFLSEQLHVQDDQTTDKLNFIYARDYNILKDIHVLKRAWKKLDRR
ncbi:MAG: glycosyltransferase [Bacteroidetes bacterium]|nr:MAG: glycosyltransferase [Bacteroidota bacterium]